MIRSNSPIIFPPSQVRWLATTTPAPKSPLHGHRIMCLCVLPLPKSQPRLPSAHDNCRGTIFVAGDSGGGVTVFQLQHHTAADGSAGDGGRREERSRPAGRWTTSGERPVLSLAHARVPSSAAPDTAVHLIATGDTGGTVTLWEFLPGRGSGVLAPMGGGNVREGASDVRGGFVHRGPAGKRRGGNRRSADGSAAEEPPPCPGLVPVLSYRAHQVPQDKCGVLFWGCSVHIAQWVIARSRFKLPCVGLLGYIKQVHLSRKMTSCTFRYSGCPLDSKLLGIRCSTLLSIARLRNILQPCSM